MENLPTEDLLKICESLSFSELSALARTSYGVAQVCKLEIDRKKALLVDEIIYELLFFTPTREELIDAVAPIMKSELLPIIKKLLSNPATDANDPDYRAIYYILDPTVGILADERHNYSEIFEVLQKYKLVTF